MEADPEESLTALREGAEKRLLDTSGIGAGGRQEVKAGEWGHPDTTGEAARPGVHELLAVP